MATQPLIDFGAMDKVAKLVPSQGTGSGSIPDSAAKCPHCENITTDDKLGAAQNYGYLSCCKCGYEFYPPRHRV